IEGLARAVLKYWNHATQQFFQNIHQFNKNRNYHKTLRGGFVTEKIFYFRGSKNPKYFLGKEILSI
ncbi:MAG: hypothetical protein AABX07_01385, partial [Nanoarchaeota archaeon]